MNVILIYNFPRFDTGLFESATFCMSGGDAWLVVSVAEHDDIFLRFERIRWHEFTALYNCTEQQVESAYSRLVELKESEPLAQYVAADRASATAYRELHHFRVFLDEHGCHEVFAESANAFQKPKTGVRASA